MDSTPGFIQGGLILTGVCAGSLALAFVFVALCSRERRVALRNNDADSRERRRRRKLRRYQARYFDELKAAHEECGEDDITEETLAGLKDLCIEEDTPVGVVRMHYNAEKESFEYYTDTRNIEYKTLDTVARSFCLAHGCPQLCVNYMDEFYQAKGAILKDRAQAQEDEEREHSDAEQEESAPASESTSVFAKFKTYNDRVNKPVKERTRIVTERANRFSFLGTIADYDSNIRAERTKKTAIDPDLSYADFKKKEA